MLDRVAYGKITVTVDEYFASELRVLCTNVMDHQNEGLQMYRLTVSVMGLHSYRMYKV